MSAVYTYSEARQNLASILEKVMRDGMVRIKRKDGQLFVISPEITHKSPFDVDGIDVDLTSEEIVAFVRESRSYR